MRLPLFPSRASFPRMRSYIFLVGLCILGSAAAAHYLLPRQQAFEFLEGALKLGGGIIICGVFSLKMQWHGIVGAGILSLLGAARGLGNLPGFFKFLTGDRSRDTAPLLELGVTVLCLLLLIKVVRALYQERVRRMLESED